MIRNEEIEAVNEWGHSISFNSIPSFERLKNSLSKKIKKMMRLNPEISFLEDERYDPCREYSKLGATLECFKKWIEKSDNSIDGIHLHTNCQSNRSEEIVKTIDKVENTLGDTLYIFNTINLGGGYLFNEGFLSTINEIQLEWKKKYDLEIIIEPSFDISNSAGYLYSSVVDIFRMRDKEIAILDTSVNHFPEVFEYQDKPHVANTSQHYTNSYILAGASCFSGDIFGEHSFEKPLNLGDKIIFKNIGSYSHVRANTFNGIPIPKIFVDDIK